MSMVPVSWSLLLATVYLVIVTGFQSISVIFGVELLRTARFESPATQQLPSVSIIIPARNESDAISECLDGVAAQDYASQGGRLEVLVVDGGSSDGTAELARTHRSKPTVIAEPPLPPGWVGKSWACQQGFLVATGERLLFLDADVSLAPGTLRTAVTRQDVDGADLVSLAPRIVMRGFWERVVLPVYAQFFLTFYAAPLVNRDRSRYALANGQFLLFTRRGYTLSGGHASIHGQIMEDVRLAEKLRVAGGRIRIYWGLDMISTRMYASRCEMNEGIIKVLHGTKFNPLRQGAFIAMLPALFLSMFLTLGLSLVGVLPSVWLWVSGSLIAVLAAKHICNQIALRAPPADGLLFPLGWAYFTGLLIVSLVRGVKARAITWKGRVYSFDVAES